MTRYTTDPNNITGESYVVDQNDDGEIILDPTNPDHDLVKLGSSTPDFYWVNWFDRWFQPLTDHPVGNFLTALLVRFWFIFQ